MAAITADRCKETSNTTGTGTITLAGAVDQFQSFTVAFPGASTVVQYAIVGQGTTEWEVGEGTFTASGTTLSRDVIKSSSNAGAAVNFSAGTKDVFATATAAHLLAAVLGPASATDNAIAIYDSTTGKLIKVTVLIVDPTTGDIQGPAAGFAITGGTATTADLTFKTTTGVGGSGSLMRFLVGNNGALEAMRLLYDGQAVFRTINIGSTNGTDSDATVAFDRSSGYFGAGWEFGWGNTTSPAGYGFARDLTVGRLAAGQLTIKNKTNGQANNLKTSATTVNLSGATATATALFPAKCVRLGVSYRVTAIATSGDGGTSINVGDGTDADLYGATKAFAAGTTGNLDDATANPTVWNAAAGDIVFTCNGGTFSGGVIRVVAHYIDLTAPTS